MTNALTRSQQEASNLSALLRARNAFIWVVTQEEARVEGYLAEAAAKAGYVPMFWDVASGVVPLGGTPRGDANDIGEVLTRIQQGTGDQRTVWVLRDLQAWITGGGLSPALTLRQVRNLARNLPGAPRERAQAIIVLSPSSDIPPELQGHATVIEWPSPDRAEVATILDGLVEAYGLDLNGARDQAIDAAVGLSGSEVQAVYSKSLVTTKTIDPKVVSAEKKRVIAKSGVLEWLDPLPGGLAGVGGLDAVKAWAVKRHAAFTPAARAYGLPAPKGILVAGISGCGKTLLAKALAGEWSYPLIRFDFGALKSKFVGESEGNLRKAQRTIDSLGPCIVLVDEIEKALAGATQGAADGGVSADALGSFLSWMNDRTSPAFVIATANDITSIVNNAPELLRKGRFDEVFWVDVPTATERVEVLNATLRQHGRTIDPLHVQAAASNCDKFTGAELASLVPEAMFTAFADGEREVTAQDIVEAAKTVVPLADTAKEKIKSMRDWAATRARYATTPDKVDSSKPARTIDLD